MAITPPSDIISDVARAADPGRYQVAVQRLAEGANPVEGPEFERALNSVAGGPLVAGGFDTYTARNSLKNEAETAEAVKAKQAFRHFEAFVLQSFIESMLPKDENSFGKGSAGSVWRSMMAEQIGAQVARAGGIGIAEGLLARRATGSSGVVSAETAASLPSAAAPDKA